ncbi:MAG TPA: lipoprotein-releasing ABC transporter permease subunit [Quisquiliibacterium sp.]|nr:lipoprotein-releasing ABC transporter permease subunit [Quisquiliibacterium sp.]HQP66885.1 lipoprotein-releasing ABC transporter permease subunit [Quisquiliibacterium sp.]
MQLPFEFQIGLRYTRSGRRAGRRNGFISFISALSVAGIALGVAALITVLSVMNGFQKEVRDRMLSVLSHIEVLAGRTPMTDPDTVIAQARRTPHVIAGAPFVAGQAMLTYEDAVRGVIVRGIDPARERDVADFLAQQRQDELARLAPGEFGVMVGRELARQLLLEVGARLTMIAPQGTMTPAGVVPRMRQLTVVGIFDSGHYEYDSALVLMHLQDAGRLFRVEGVSGVRLKTDDMMLAPRIGQALAATLGPDLFVRDWSRENRNWFAAVQIEKRMMFIILTLIIAVAAFNLVSMLVMTVTDKQSDIAILRTLGASPGSIMKVFVVQGALVGLLGTLMGVVLGVLLALNVGGVVAAVERVFGFQVLPKGVYFINHLPSDLHWNDVSFIGLTACALSLLSTLYPSWRASRVRPAEALRHE